MSSVFYLLFLSILVQLFYCDFDSVHLSHDKLTHDGRHVQHETKFKALISVHFQHPPYDEYLGLRGKGNSEIIIIIKVQDIIIYTNHTVMNQIKMCLVL